MNNLVATCKRDLVEIYKHALEAIKPDRLVKEAVSFREGCLIIKNVQESATKPTVYSLSKRRLHVIGGGKCVISMARGLAELVNQKHGTGVFGAGCLSAPIMAKAGFDSDLSAQTLLKSIGLECRFGSNNNLPDEDSVSATSFMLDRIEKVCQEDKAGGMLPLFVVLISGGGSACLSSPKGISLDEKTRLIKELVQKGADIVELNKVRRCLSHVKGGNLARHIRQCNPDAQIISLIISDVIGDPLEFIASGPTFINYDSDESPSSSMNEVMQKYGLRVDLRGVADDNQNVRSFDLDDGFVINRVIGNNAIALQAVVEKASALNYKVQMLGGNFTGSTSDILAKILASRQLDESLQAKSLLVCGGEPTVERRAGETWGLGGRAQEMALDYMIARLSYAANETGSQFADVFLAGSTDGQDGPTDVAACMASHAEWLLERPFDLEDALAAKRSHNSFKFWNERKPDWLLRFGPTGTNVMDLYFFATVQGGAGK